jgi:hypothetical protein
MLILIAVRRSKFTFQCLVLNKSARKIQRRSRAIAQAVSRWLPTAAARVRARVWSCGICGGQRGAGARFLLVLRFPLPIRISTATMSTLN